MYPINSNVLSIFQNGSKQYFRMTIGSTVIDGSRVMQGSCSINRYVQTNESVAIGSVVASELTLSLNNYDGTYDNTDFIGSEAYVEIGVEDTNHTVQYIPMGYFTFDEATRTKNTVSLAALDRMTKFDVSINASDLSFPYTLTNLLTRICTLCGVTKGSFGTITNSSYSVASLPSEAKTYRDLLRWICEVSGSNGYFSYDGKLYLGWYGTTSQVDILPSNRTQSDIDKDTFTITGVTILTGDNQKYTAGTNVRPITINNNPFITASTAQSVANTLNTKLNGFTYTPFTAIMLPSPHLWPMDRGTFTTADGTTVAVSVTEVTYKLNGNTSIGCKGEMQVRGRSYGLADQTFYASNIAAGAVTADKISVDDLNALNATIAGWNIGTDEISKTVDGKTAKISSATPKVLMSSQNHYAEVNGNAEITTYYGGGQWADVSQGETVMKGQEINQDYDVWEVHATYADWVRKSESSLTDATLTLKGRDIDPETLYLEDNFKTSVLNHKDLTFNGNSIKRLTQHLAQMWSTAIPANANLNTTTYLKVGQYYVERDVTAQTLTNCPSTAAFNMTVEAPISATYDDESGTHKYRLRKITSLQGDSWLQYVYTSSTAGVWTYGTWDRLLKSNKIFTEGEDLYYKGTKATHSMIRFIDNTVDTYGNGIAIGGGGQAIIGGGESANVMKAEAGTAGSEIMWVGNDGAVEVHTNLQNGWSDRKTFTFNNDGGFFVPRCVYIYNPSKTYWGAFIEGNETLTANRVYSLPNGSGTLALKGNHVLKTGDTMTGALTLTDSNVNINDATAERYVRIQTKSGNSLSLDFDSNGRHGIWSRGYCSSMTDTSQYAASAGWLICREPNGTIRLPFWANIGSATRPIYMNSDGCATAGSPFVPRYYTYKNGTVASGTWIKISINSTAAWMLSFTINIYSGYKMEQINVSGYNYSSASQYWYSPKAVLASSTDKSSVEVKFGYDGANKLWVAVPVENYYGVSISDLNVGYVDMVIAGLFSFSEVTTLSGTTQKTVTAREATYTPLTQFTPVTGSASNPTLCWYSKYGKVVEVAMSVSGLTVGSSNVLLYTLPSGYRPQRDIMVMGHNGSSVGCPWLIRSDGEIYVIPTSNTVRMNATFITE